MAYHAYQSFKSEEVTPERCHRLGVELAKRMWDEEYQVLETTHFNTGTYLPQPFCGQFHRSVGWQEIQLWQTGLLSVSPVVGRSM